MIRSLTLLLVSCLVLAASAQTMFIPDTYLRTWLNNAKPGVVDGSGNCDTTSWNAVPPSNVYMYFSGVPDNSTVDLTGIQYLKMATLSISDGAQSNINVIWPGYPRANTHLILTNIDAQLFTPSILPLPAAMSIFECDACGLATIPAFSGVMMHFKNIDLSGQTVTVPNSVGWLTLDNDNLSTLPSMPNVAMLSINDDPLTSWTNLPTGLASLTANNVGLTYLPTLPVTLGTLSYTDNGLLTLPALPASLGTVFLQNNALTSIPAFPPSLSFLVVSHNPITSFPSMPSGLANVTADSCELVTLGPLASGLNSLSLVGNPITDLPALPGNLTTLNLKNCTALECLPLLPQSLVTLQLYNSGVNCLPNIPPNLNTTGGQNNLGIAPDYCDLTNTSCQLLTPYATGTVFNDADANGVFDTGEAPRSYGIVSAQPGDYLAGSDINGRYVLPLDIGTFTVDGLPSLYEPITTPQYTVTFAGPGEVDSLNHVGYEHVPGIYDLTTDIGGSVVRPGFYTNAWITVRNVGTEPTDALVQFTYDPDLEYISSSYTPNSVTGNVIEWNSGTLFPGNTWHAHITFYAQPDVPIGTAIDHSGLSTPDQGDLTPADNLATYTDTVVGSYDPNDKRVEPSMLSPQEVLDGKRVEYTVRFQNTGTFMAERVLITDTLSNDLQWTSMQQISSSHENSWFISQGVLYVLFEDITLPDSASDEPGSHGFVKFSFVPSSSLMLGESVGNVANIYFDFNEPIITNEAVFTVDATASIARISDDGLRTWPNPVEQVLYIEGATGRNIDVLDVTGRVVLRDRSAGALHGLDVRSLASGGYTVRVVGIGSHLFIKR
jgi:uncharacterized repeat protein (TIGR01451 family)